MVKKKNTMTFLIISILFLSIFYIFIPAEICSATGTTLHVGSGQTYSNIQDAIDAANESDTVYVHSGTYNENLVIDKAITLTGEGSGSVTINGNGDHTIKVYNDSVQISGFTIKNTGESYGCVFLSSVTSCLITNNIIKDGGNGVYLVNSDSNTVKDNTIESNNIGIYISGSDSNTIKNNIIRNNNANGVFIPSTSNSNTIYLNDFDDNLNSNARDEGSNNWYYSSQGNYWDDYNDYDSNEDGIGDNPYITDGSGGNQDNYPLGDFLSSNQKPIATINNPSGSSTITEGDPIYFSGTGDDPDSGDTIEAYNWRSSIDGQLSTHTSFSTSSLSVGTHIIYFKVKDNHGAWSSEKTRSVTVTEAGDDNEKPTAYIFSPSEPITKQHGETVEFRGRGTDPDGGQPIEYSWRSDIDDFLSDLDYFTKNDLTVGQHTIYFKVKDDEGEWSPEESTTVTILSAPSNNPPVADAGGPYTVNVNQSITFDGSSSYDPDDGDSITSYRWDFGDGSTDEGVSPEHTYTSEENYTVELTVTDSHGEQTKITTHVSIGSQVNGQNGNGGEDNGIPGFETIIGIIAVAFIVFFRRFKRI